MVYGKLSGFYRLTLSNDNGLANTTALAALPNAAEMPALKYCMDKGFRMVLAYENGFGTDV